MSSLDTKIPSDVSFGSKDEFGMGVDVSTEIDDITPKEIWDRKDEWMQMAQTSKENWDGLMDEQRESLVRMVKSSLERMHDRANDWIPEALEVEGGRYMDVKIRILFTDIDKEIERNEQATSFQVEAAQKATADWLAD